MSFVVENGLNTSYIDSLLVALFYKSTHIQNMLLQYPAESKFIYLQELINNNFVDKIRQNFSIESSVVNEIRNYSFICGWKNNVSNVAELYNVIDYSDFLLKGFGYNNFEIDIIELNNSEEYVKSLSLPYIEVNVKCDTHIKDLINEWKNKNIKNKQSLICYNFKEIPMIIPIYINRKCDDGYISLNKVDIYKRIKFKGKKTNLSNDCQWTIHSVICFSTSGGGNYYSLIKYDSNNWYIFGNDRIPSIMKFDMTNKDMCDKIKQECVILFYIFDDTISSNF